MQRPSGLMPLVLLSGGIHAVAGMVALVLTRPPETASLPTAGGPLRIEASRASPPTAPVRKALAPRAEAPREGTPAVETATEAVAEANPLEEGGGPAGSSVEGGTDGQDGLPSEGLALAARLDEAIRRELRYPAALRRQRRQGTVQLRVLLAEDGGLKGELSKGSGDGDLDRIALDALARALGNPGLRQDARQTAKRARRSVSFTLPVRFSIQ